MNRFRHFAALALCAVLAACQTNDLAEPPVPLGDFSLGLNIVVTDKIQKVVISRDASPEDWEKALKKAIEDRFGRYNGPKLYNLGISIDAYALAPPGVPLVLKPKSALGITANIWDDAAQQKLNVEGKQLIIFEKMSGETVVGSGLTRSKQQQMDILSYNAAKAIEGWLLENPEWFGLPPKPVAAAPTGTSFSTPPAPVIGPVLPEVVPPVAATATE
jgi:hypothetical protein